MSTFIIRRPDGMRARVRLDNDAAWAHPDILREAVDQLRPPMRSREFQAWAHLFDAVVLIEHIADKDVTTESIIAQVRQYRRRIKADRVLLGLGEQE